MMKLFSIMCNNLLNVPTVHHTLSPCVLKLMRDIRTLIPALEPDVDKLVSKIREVYGINIADSGAEDSSSPKVEHSRLADNINDVKQKMGEISEASNTVLEKSDTLQVLIIQCLDY